MLVMKKGKIIKTISVKISNGKEIKFLQYKKVKAVNILEYQRKMSFSKRDETESVQEVFKTRKVMRSKLNNFKLVKGIDTSAVSLLRYSAAFVS